MIVAWPALAQAQTSPTFTKDIAPIIWNRCASCHRPGEIGPFSLITFDDVRRHATLIADVTARRLMPPWKPVPGKGDFQSVRRLTDPELQSLQRWIKDGAPEGDPSALPPLPNWSEGWRLGPPDLIVRIGMVTLDAVGEFRHLKGAVVDGKVPGSLREIEIGVGRRMLEADDAFEAELR